MGLKSLKSGRERRESYAKKIQKRRRKLGLSASYFAFIFRAFRVRLFGLR
jgi:hypothetical protein